MPSAAVPRIASAFCCLLCLALPAASAINAFNLGASYDSTQSNAVFRVYSSRATRIEVDLYMAPMNSAEVLSVPLNADPGTNIFSVSIPVAREE
jgi:glycogen operon protein